jgi:hypothetical protein
MAHHQARTKCANVPVAQRLRHTFAATAPGPRRVARGWLSSALAPRDREDVGSLQLLVHDLRDRRADHPQTVSTAATYDRIAHYYAESTAVSVLTA